MSLHFNYVFLIARGECAFICKVAARSFLSAVTNTKSWCDYWRQGHRQLCCLRQNYNRAINNSQNPVAAAGRGVATNKSHFHKVPVLIHTSHSLYLQLKSVGMLFITATKILQKQQCHSLLWCYMFLECELFICLKWHKSIFLHEELIK